MEKVFVSSELDSSTPMPDEPGKRTESASEVETRAAAQTDEAQAASEAQPADESSVVEAAPMADAASVGGDAPQAQPADASHSPSAEEPAGAVEGAVEAESEEPREAAESVESTEAAASIEDEDVEEEEEAAGAQPLELIEESPEDEEIKTDWYILKVQVNRESTICDALMRRVKMAGLERYFGKVIVPTEEVQEFTKTGKKRIVKRKLYPGYIMVNMAINDDTWFLVRETPGIGDFTGSAGKPTPMQEHEIASILRKTEPDTEDLKEVKTAIKVKPGDKVRVKEGYFQNFEGDVESIDEANGRITVLITIFNRTTPVELEHWQVEEV